MAPVGQLFVLSGPSGVGKSSLREQVLERIPGLQYSISHTTRAPREGEREGADYHFTTPEAFLVMREEGAFVEWAQVHGHYYGTSRERLGEHLRAGRDVVVEIDIQGARQLKAHFPRACFIFVLPPDRETLRRRLRQRGTESETSVRSRLDNAWRELLESVWYDYLIINDTFEEAVEALAAVIQAQRCCREVVLPRITSLLQPQ
jgi:guanylate kinase